MNKKLLSFSFLTFITFSNISYAQQGPGGAGNSASNVLWLDANRGVTLAAGAVNLWADQSGNGNNAAASAAGSRPAFVAGSVNGYPSFDFDGSTDELRVNDHNSLDLTQWHIFIVVAVDVQKNYNAWFTKGDDGQENYEILSYSDGNIHNPTYYTDGTRTFPSSAAGQVVVGAFNIIEYSYSIPVGRDVYKNYGSINTDDENKTPQINAMDIYIGNEKTTSRFLNGDIAEAIMYNGPLNSAQRIIVNNYLAAKYNITLTANDIYTMDNAGNGNYDHDVAGIGQVDAANTQTDSRGSGIVEVSNPTNLGDGEYFIWGHNNSALAATATDVPAGVISRFPRSWRISEVGEVGSVDVDFNLTGLGTVNAGHLRLLIDTDNDGLFADETPISGASGLGANVYRFSGVSNLNNNTRFTLATTSPAATPLPVELLSFNAIYNDKKVDLTWTTATEINNDYFTIEKTKDGSTFETVSTVDGSGNSSSIIEYSDKDYAPYEGLSYYRLAQTDFNGEKHYSALVPVNYTMSDDGFTIYPNPASDASSVVMNLSFNEGQEVLVVVRDIQGKEFYSKVIVTTQNNELIAVDPEHKIAAGVYIVIATSENKIFSKKLIIK